MSSIIVAIRDLGSACASEGARGPLKLTMSDRAFDILLEEVREIARWDTPKVGLPGPITIQTIAGEVMVYRQSEDTLEWIPYRRENPLDPTPE